MLGIDVLLHLRRRLQQRLNEIRARAGQPPTALLTSSVEQFCSPASANRSMRSSTRRSSAKVGAGTSPIMMRFARIVSLKFLNPRSYPRRFSRIVSKPGSTSVNVTQNSGSRHPGTVRNKSWASDSHLKVSAGPYGLPFFCIIRLRSARLTIDNSKSEAI